MIRLKQLLDVSIVYGAMEIILKIEFKIYLILVLYYFSFTLKRKNYDRIVEKKLVSINLIKTKFYYNLKFKGAI